MTDVMQTSKPRSENKKRDNIPSDLSSPISINSSSNVSRESCRRGDILELEPSWNGVGCDETKVRGDEADEDGSCRFPPSILRNRTANGTPKRKIAMTRRMRAMMTPIC